MSTIATFKPTFIHSYRYDVRRLYKEGRLREALRILHKAENILDSCTYVSLWQACTKNNALTEGKLIHAHINVNPNFRVLMANPIVPNSLITMYVKCGELAFARRVFDQMPQRNTCSWTVTIAAYARHSFVQEALFLFCQMQKSHVKLNQFSFSSVLPACAKLGSLPLGMEVHEQIIIRGFQSDLVVANALVDMYAKCGRVEDARQLFDKIAEPDVVSWTAMITGWPGQHIAFCRNVNRGNVSKLQQSNDAGGLHDISDLETFYHPEVGSMDFSKKFRREVHVNERKSDRHASKFHS